MTEAYRRCRSWRRVCFQSGWLERGVPPWWIYELVACGRFLDPRKDSARSG